MKLPKVLYFVDGVAPTADDIKDASAIAAHVVYRNARAVASEGALEDCDGVAGKVPPQYAKLPSAQLAVQRHATKIAAIASKVGDSPAPSAPATDPAPNDGGSPDPAATGGDNADASATAGAQEGAGAGESATDQANVPAPGVAPAGAAGSAWRSN